MTVSAIVSRIQTLTGALTGIKGAPLVIPNNINDYPWIVAYPGRGRWDWPGYGAPADDVGEIVIDLHAGPQDKGICQAVGIITGYWESLPKALLSDSTLEGLTNWLRLGTPAIATDGLLSMGYGGVATYGCRWRIRYSKEETV